MLDRLADFYIKNFEKKISNIASREIQNFKELGMRPNSDLIKSALSSKIFFKHKLSIIANDYIRRMKRYESLYADIKKLTYILRNSKTEPFDSVESLLFHILNNTDGYPNDTLAVKNQIQIWIRAHIKNEEEFSQAMKMLIRVSQNSKSIKGINYVSN